MTVASPPSKLKPKDFASDQEVRWCPGCGDYAILKAIQRTLSEVGANRENTVFISGIGCAARFPYYMSTYGFHTIHGRAPAVATGTKLANPELDIWVMTGDGDALSIGGNHLLHILRRNVDLQIILFNNEIYGLTKGQYSPTSRPGTKSPSTPLGSIEAPVSPALLALGAGGRFVARGIDTQQPKLVETLKRARANRGASFVEIFQNCKIYNDGVFDEFTDKSVSTEMQIHLEHGKPLLFGKDGSRGVRLKCGALELETVDLEQDGISPDEVLIHDETNLGLAAMLASMRPPRFPVALGVLYCRPKKPYDESVLAQMAEAAAGNGNADLNALFRQGQTWTVAG
ncbi:MAG: 2-oxoacid:ferredoxin oxidoreductase subunit beta [Gemmatimonadales bacterium]